MDSVTQRQLRNDSGEILRRVAAGETVQVTRNHTPVAVLSPARTRRAVPGETVRHNFAAAAPVDGDAFRRDTDRIVDQTLLDPYGRPQ